MKQLIQRLLFGYRPNPNAIEPKRGSILKYKGHNAEAIHSALLLMQYNIRNAEKIN